MLAELGSGITAVIKFSARILSFARKIPFIDDAVDRFRSNLLNPVVVRLVRHADDPDLDEALELYRKKIPDDQRFDPADVVRWVRANKLSRDVKGQSEWLLVFLIATYHRRVRGFVICHYPPGAQLAFFAYMVVVNTPGVDFNAVSRSLTHDIARRLKKMKELRGCRGFVMEVEDPRKEKLKGKQQEALARISRFCTLAEMNGFSLRIFDFDYRQPKLSHDDAEHSEHPMLLLSARARQPDSTIVSYRSEVEELLSFIYTRVYPEDYSTDAEANRKYKEYCVNLFQHQIASLPASIGSITTLQLANQLGRTKSGAPKKAASRDNP